MLDTSAAVHELPRLAASHILESGSVHSSLAPKCIWEPVCLLHSLPALSSHRGVVGQFCFSMCSLLRVAYLALLFSHRAWVGSFFSHGGWGWVASNACQPVLHTTSLAAGYCTVPHIAIGLVVLEECVSKGTQRHCELNPWSAHDSISMRDSKVNNQLKISLSTSLEGSCY